MKKGDTPKIMPKLHKCRCKKAKVYREGDLCKKCQVRRFHTSTNAYSRNITLPKLADSGCTSTTIQMR